MKSNDFSNGWPAPPKRGLRIFLDRCITPRLKRGLLKFRFHVVTMQDVYPNDGRDVQDVEWIRDCGERGYIAFTANPTMVNVPHEMEAVRGAGTKVFCLASAQHTNEGRALIYGRHLLRIVRRAQKPGPCFWRMSPGQIITRDIP